CRRAPKTDDGRFERRECRHTTADRSSEEAARRAKPWLAQLSRCHAIAVSNIIGEPLSDESHAAPLDDRHRALLGPARADDGSRLKEVLVNEIATILTMVVALSVVAERVNPQRDDSEAPAGTRKRMRTKRTARSRRYRSLQASRGRAPSSNPTRQSTRTDATNCRFAASSSLA